MSLLISIYLFLCISENNNKKKKIVLTNRKCFGDKSMKVEGKLKII